MAALICRIARVVVMSCVVLCVIVSPASAQHGGAAPPTRAVPIEAREFGFLVGQFELSVHPARSGMAAFAARIHGAPKLTGSWKGWRGLDGFGIEDELRITDESGNPRVLAHAVRYYDASVRHWIASTIDVYRGKFTASSAEWRDNTMTVTSHSTDADGKAVVSRGRYTDITPTSFTFRQERSVDEGRTWENGVLRIDAKRVAATAPR